MQQFMLDWCSEWPLEQVFLTVGQNNFGNKIPNFAQKECRCQLVFQSDLPEK